MRKHASAQDSKIPIPLFMDGNPIGGPGSLNMFMKNKLRRKHLLGGLMFREYPDRLVVSHMVIEPKARRKGYNSLMVDTIEKDFGQTAEFYDVTDDGRKFMLARGGKESKTNPDENIRRLERIAKQTAAQDDIARYWTACLRAGELPKPNEDNDWEQLWFLDRNRWFATRVALLSFPNKWIVWPSVPDESLVDPLARKDVYTSEGKALAAVRKALQEVLRHA